MSDNIFVITGFLGSGKTTYIVKLLEFFAGMELKSALIINEIGEIGIDNQYIKQLDFNIYELFGGCICCTLSSDLESTVAEITERYDPSVIIVEPSGIADPVQTLKSVTKSGKYNVTNFFVLDPTRMDMFQEILAPLLEASIKFADVVLVNKIKLIGKEEIDEAKGLVREYNKTTTVFTLDFEDPLPEELRELIKNRYLR